MAIEIVDFPIKNGGSFHCYGTVHQRVSHLSQKYEHQSELDHHRQLEIPIEPCFCHIFSDDIEMVFIYD